MTESLSEKIERLRDDCTDNPLVAGAHKEWLAVINELTQRLEKVNHLAMGLVWDLADSDEYAARRDLRSLIEVTHLTKPFP